MIIDSVTLQSSLYKDTQKGSKNRVEEVRGVKGIEGIERIKRVEVVEVVRVMVAEGEGTDSSPVELVEQYWGTDGRYIGKIKIRKRERRRCEG